MSDADEVAACPECGRATLRTGNDDHRYACHSCDAYVDDPVYRPPDKPAYREPCGLAGKLADADPSEVFGDD